MFSDPLTAWILPSYSPIVCSWAHLKSTLVKLIFLEDFTLPQPCLIFSLWDPWTQKRVCLGELPSLRPYYLAHWCLEDFFQPDPIIYGIVSFLQQNNMMYSLQHKNPKKMQFQRFPSWCEKMLKQLKKWLVIPHGIWASFALEIQLEAEEGRRGGCCLWHPCSQSKILHLFFTYSPISFLLLYFPP